MKNSEFMSLYEITTRYDTYRYVKLKYAGVQKYS